MDGGVAGGGSGGGGKVAQEPGVDCFGGLRTRGEVEADGVGIGFCAGTGGGWEEEEDGGGLEHHLYISSTSWNKK